jgi:hypothetical protein
MTLLSSSGLTSTPSTSLQTSIGDAGAADAANVLAKGNALINNPTPAYTGQLTAGTSELQDKAFKGLANLTLPSTLVNAGNNLQDIAAKQAAGTYSGPTSTNQYTGTGAYTPSNMQSTYSSPNAYQGQNVTSGTFDAAAAQQYMNPYLQASLNPQLEEARRQAQITQMGNAAKATSQGAFGGSRSALLESENNRNLGSNLANITGQGYNTAYNNAANQFNADQARNMTAQQANVQQAQFAASQGMTDAQMKAQYGMTAQQANEASRQFGQNQALSNAQNAAQYGQAAQAANLQNSQFGATYGLQALQNAATSQQAAANAGATQAQYGLANLNALSTAGNTQQAQNQAGLNALYNQYLDQRNLGFTNLKNQADLVKSLGGSNQNTYGAQQSDLQKLAGVTGLSKSVIDNLKASGVDAASIKSVLKAAGINPDTLSQEVGNTLPPGMTQDDVAKYQNGWTKADDGSWLDETGNPVSGSPVDNSQTGSGG